MNISGYNYIDYIVHCDLCAYLLFKLSLPLFSFHCNPNDKYLRSYIRLFFNNNNNVYRTVIINYMPYHAQ
jgi:hypothetical protein